MLILQIKLDKWFPNNYELGTKANITMQNTVLKLLNGQLII
jgi:hypothetical protein